MTDANNKQVKTEKDKPAINKEYELYKVQIYADRTHTVLTIWASFAFVVLSLLAVFYTLFYEEIFQFESFKAFTGWEGIVLIAALSLIALVLTGVYHRNTVSHISAMIETVTNGDPLPPLDQLQKWKKDD